MIARLLDELAAQVRRFVVLGDPEAATIALWVAHTHVHDAFDYSPYLAVLSPVKRSGKTKLLSVLELVVARPWRVVMPSEAVLYRKIARDHPTLLLDEVDAIWQSGKRNENHEPLRALLNAGNEVGTIVPRCSGPRGDVLREFATFCPKALAGIGMLPDTVLDRSIVIAMKRRARREPVERFRRRDVAAEIEPLREALAAWGEAAADSLAGARPALLEELDDRALDAWEPLLAIADLAGDEWARRARSAARSISGGGDRQDDSLGVQLLVDLRRVFDRHDRDRLATTTILDELHADDEGPWLAYGRDRKPVSAAQVGRLLRPFKVRSRPIRLVDGSVAKGYLRESFEAEWERYVTVTSDSEGLQGYNPHGSAENEALDLALDEVFGSGANPHDDCDVTPLPLERAESRDDENGRVPIIGDDDYLAHLFAALEGGRVTEREWKQGERAHRFVVERRASSDS